MAKNSVVVDGNETLLVDVECIATKLEYLTEGFLFHVFDNDKRVFITVKDALDFIKRNPRKLRQTKNFMKSQSNLERMYKNHYGIEHEVHS